MHEGLHPHSMNAHNPSPSSHHSHRSLNIYQINYFADIHDIEFIAFSHVFQRFPTLSNWTLEHAIEINVSMEASASSPLFAIAVQGGRWMWATYQSIELAAQFAKQNMGLESSYRIIQAQMHWNLDDSEIFRWTCLFSETQSMYSIETTKMINLLNHP